MHSKATITNIGGLPLAYPMTVAQAITQGVACTAFIVALVAVVPPLAALTGVPRVACLLVILFVTRIALLTLQSVRLRRDASEEPLR